MNAVSEDQFPSFLQLSESFGVTRVSSVWVTLHFKCFCSEGSRLLVNQFLRLWNDRLVHKCLLRELWILSLRNHLLFCIYEVLL
jgi:hypothetical protein